jgi:hypothetical protein
MRNTVEFVKISPCVFMCAHAQSIAHGSFPLVKCVSQAKYSDLDPRPRFPPEPIFNLPFAEMWLNSARMWDGWCTTVRSRRIRVIAKLGASRGHGSIDDATHLDPYRMGTSIAKFCQDSVLAPNLTNPAVVTHLLQKRSLTLCEASLMIQFHLSTDDVNLRMRAN